MVNRVQTLRSSTPGVRPTGRPVGELYTNYPDNQLGVVNAAGTAFDLLAVRFFSSLATYVIGDYVKQGLQLYRAIANNGPGAFNGANWSQIQSAADGTYVPLAGGTMTGPLVLSGEPAAALGAATKQTVDLKAPLASPFFTGNPQAPTPTAGDNTASLATTSFVTTSFAPLASPALTGNPTAPTPAAGDADTSIATTAFVANNSGVTVSDTAPVTPPQGKLWFDSVSGNLYVRYDDGTSAQWVVANGVPVDLSGYATTAYVDSRPKNTSYRNLLRRNGGFEVWQRGAGGAASIPVVASFTNYSADGWYLTTTAVQASVVSQQAGLVTDSQWCARVQRNNGQTGTGVMTFGFPIDTDELWPMLGGFVRLSLTLRAGANWSPASGNISIALNVGTGVPAKFTVGYAGASVAALLTQALTTTATRYQVNTAAIIPTTTRQAEVTLTWTPVGTASTNDYFEIDDVQLEIVPAATGYVSSDFERLNFLEQLLLCQRHYFKTTLYNQLPQGGNGLGSGELYWGQQIAGAVNQMMAASHRYAVPMRSIPTVVPVGVTTQQIRDVNTSTDWTGTNVVRGGTTGVELNGTPPAGSAVGHESVGGFYSDAGI